MAQAAVQQTCFSCKRSIRHFRVLKRARRIATVGCVVGVWWGGDGVRGEGGNIHCIKICSRHKLDTTACM
jgi:hypothetical protein